MSLRVSIKKAHASELLIPFGVRQIGHLHNFFMASL